MPTVYTKGKICTALKQGAELLPLSLAEPGCPPLKTSRKDLSKTASSVRKWQLRSKAEDLVYKCSFLFCTSYLWQEQEGRWSHAFPAPLRRKIACFQTNCSGSASWSWSDSSKVLTSSNDGWSFLPLYCMCFACTFGGITQANVFLKTASKINYIFRLCLFFPLSFSLQKQN